MRGQGGPPPGGRARRAADVVARLPVRRRPARRRRPAGLRRDRGADGLDRPAGVEAQRRPRRVTDAQERAAAVDPPPHHAGRAGLGGAAAAAAVATAGGARPCDRSMPMRPDVALIAPYPPAGERHGGHSGVASYTANLAHGLVAAGLDVEVVAPELDGDPAEFADGAGPRAAGLPARSPGAPARHGRGRRGARRPASPTSSSSCSCTAVRRRSSACSRRSAGARRTLGTTPLVTTMHQVVEPSTIDRSYTKLHRVGAPAVVARGGIAGVQAAISRLSAATIVHEAPFRRVIPSATVIPHGIEEPRPVDRDVARRALGLDDRFVVLCFGFLAPYKGIELVLDAAARAAATTSTSSSPAASTRGWTGRTASAPSCVHGTATSPRSPDGCPTPTSPTGSARRTSRCSRTRSRSRRRACWPSRSPTARPCCCRPRSPGAPARRARWTVRWRPSRWRGGSQDLARDPGALDELRRGSRLLGHGRTWPAVARQHADLYEEVRDVDRHSRRSLRAG